MSKRLEVRKDGEFKANKQSETYDKDESHYKK